MKLRVAYIILFTLVASALQAQTLGTWSNTGPILFPVNTTGQVDGIGRVCQIKFHPYNAQIMYAVSASGGAYISLNNGQIWAPMPGTEKMPNAACASICIDYTNDNIIYLSTGDPNYYNNDYGIWKSTNGGTTFTASNTGIGNRMAVEILMDPTNNSNLIAATNDGIWRTTNAGASWTGTLTGKHFRDMKMRPGSNGTVYAVTETEFFKSDDFGISWVPITSGITPPAANEGMRIGVSAADTNRVYLATTNDYGVIFKSTNGGNSFTNVYSSTIQCLVCYDSVITSGNQGDYNFDLTANPSNPDELILASHCIWRSTDGGVTWSKRTQWWHEVHTDLHHVEFNPYNNTQLFSANDGGVWLTTDPNATLWSPRSDGLAATEIYHAAQSPLIRQLISAGTQDNGEIFFDGTWKCNRGGDWGPKCVFDFLGGTTVYYLENGERRNLQPLGGGQSYNCPFVATNNSALEFVPSVTSLAFTGNDSLWKSTNINTSSPSWTLINPINETILDINSCRANNNILYVVTDGNHLYRTDNALFTTPAFLTLNTPAPTNVAASIATDKNDPNIVFLSCNKLLYRSADRGVTWTNITFNLPNLNIRKIFHDDFSGNERLFVNAGSYVYYKNNLSSSWTNYGNAFGLPSIANASDFMLYNDGTAASTLRLATYGRGIWECPIYYNLPPACNFTADKQSVCPHDTVTYSKNIYGNFTSFSWTFPGGTPSSSTLPNPVVVYNTPGVYNATLTAVGPGGNTVNTQTNYITVTLGLTSNLQEGFEGNAFPPSGWVFNNPNAGAWSHATNAGGFGLTSKSIFYDNFHNDCGGKHVSILSPKISLANTANPQVSFDVAYAMYPGYNDSLMVQISTDCGKTFSPVYVKTGSTLATMPNLTDSLLIPTATQWRKDTISLTPYIGSSVMLSFENIGHYGQGLYLDNINILIPLAVQQLSSEAHIDMFPNPSQGLVHIKGNTAAAGSVTISCFNALGQSVLEKVVTSQDGLLDTSINLSGFPAGMYFIKVLPQEGTPVVRGIILQ